MITKNSSGNNLNANYGTIIKNDGRKFDAKLLCNGTELECDIIKIAVTKGSLASADDFTVGSMISHTLTAELSGLSTGIKGLDIEYRIGLEISGSYEEITMGFFTVIELKKSLYSTTITAYGFCVSKTAGALITSATTLTGIAAAIQSSIRDLHGGSLTISFGSGINYYRSLNEPIEGKTCYQALQILASVVGGYVTETNDGNIIINRLSDTPTLDVTADIMTDLPKIEEDPFEITGVKCMVSEETIINVDSAFPNTHIDFWQSADLSNITLNSTAHTIPSGVVPNGATLTVNISYRYASYYPEPDVIYEGTQTEYLTYGTAETIELFSANEAEMNFTSYLVYTAQNTVYLRHVIRTLTKYSFINTMMSDIKYTEKIKPEVSYTSGDPNLNLENQYMTSALFTELANSLVGYEYRPGTLELAYGDPRLEGSDVLRVTDVNGDVYIMPCHSIVHKFDGGFTTEISASNPATTNNNLSDPGPLSALINDVSKSAVAAKASADAAKTAADNAQASADAAQISANSAQSDAERAHEAADDAKAEAVTAHVAADAAQGEAERAQQQASTATAYANGALDQLSVVENVVGVLDLLQKNGEYQLTEDTEVVPEKWYFTRSGAGTSASPYIYTVVSSPTGDPSDNGWYELTGIDQAIQNYVSSHIAIDDQGLWLQQQGTNYKILISSSGVIIYGADGTPVGKYGETAQIGNSAGFHIEMDGTELGFYQVNKKVAYISNNQLYITQSVVLQQMDLGARVNNNGLGQWSWKVHANGQSPPRNNLNLKWIG